MRLEVSLTHLTNGTGATRDEYGFSIVLPDPRFSDGSLEAEAIRMREVQP